MSKKKDNSRRITRKRRCVSCPCSDGDDHLTFERRMGQFQTDLKRRRNSCLDSLVLCLSRKIQLSCGWSAYENTVAWKEGRSHWWEDNRCALFTIYINMWAVSLDVSIQRRYCQPPSVHLWACCTHPTHDVNDVNDVMCEAWPHHLVYVPYSFGTVVWVLLRPIRTR